MKTMTVKDFLNLMEDMAAKQMSIVAYADYLAQRTREDKYLREEYLPIRAVLLDKRIPHTARIDLGEGTEGWDARISDAHILEVTQALPKNKSQGSDLHSSITIIIFH